MNLADTQGINIERSAVDHARRWARANLFNGVANTVLTLVSVTVAVYLIYTLTRFVFVGADWEVVDVNRRLIFLGRYPKEEQWRIWPPMWMVMGLGGLSYGMLSRGSLRDLVWLGAAVVFILAFLATTTNGMLFGGGVLISIAGYGLGRLSIGRPLLRSRLRMVTIVGWFLVIPFAIILITGFGGVKPALWGGLLLNVLLAAVGIAIGLPLGILLALSRASSLPVLKAFATSIIEITRGGPLIAWLFIARFVLPTFIPDAFQTDPIVNSMIVVSLFTGAYVAEIVRGGLQSVDRGQVEAADALGLGTFNVTVFIVLPQAIRAVIPALVSQMIALWKDTTLFAFLGFTDALSGGQAAYNQAAFKGSQIEVLVFVALLFWAVAFGMSRLSQRFEKTLGIGER